MKRDIFISYSRRDKEVVLPFVDEIDEVVGQNCWIDLNGIESGVEFEEVIMKAIDSCKVVLFMLSDSSLGSDWTKREVYYAESEGKRIVPVLIDGEGLRGWFKFHFGNIDFIDIRSAEQKEKLLRNLSAWLGVEEKANIIKSYHNSITHREDYPQQIHQLIDNMVLVEGGTFLMGIPEEHDKKIGGFYEPYKESLPRHQVTVEPFYIGKYPVTQAEWECIMGYNPSKFKDSKGLFPVNGVEWEDCQKFIKKLNNLTNENFRLPTEAEWEFAARGGNLSHAYLYAGSNDIDAVAWHQRNSNNTTHEVGLKLPNELGLYDMSGNVEEWCNDWYNNYPNTPVYNPQGPPSGQTGHVLRGGGWIGGEFECSVYHRFPIGLRDRDTENWGFRLAMKTVAW